jgi:hypothetical protein
VVYDVLDIMSLEGFSRFLWSAFFLLTALDAGKLS